MLLRAVKVQSFRNVIDTGVVDVDDRITCLLGKNESGKTALLSAICRINPVYGDTFDLSKQYPRWRLSRDRKAGGLDKVQPIECVFELGDEDVTDVEEKLGSGVLRSRQVSYARAYDDTTTMIVDVDKAAAKTDLLDTLKAPQALRDALAHVPGIAGFPEAVSELVVDEDCGFSDVEAKAVAQEAQARLGGSRSTVARVSALLEARLPKFFLFSEYETLPGRVDVTDLAGEGDEPGSSALQTARALLSLAGAEASELTGEDFEDRKAELEAVSNDLTRQVFEYWRQNQDLSVEIDVDVRPRPQPSYGQPPVVDRFLEVRVKDRRHGFTNNFDQRSSGFQWFFSFLAAFSQFEDYEHGVVVLLDEPALTLHARAQADFLRFIEERLAPVAQVLYTTHSPFMVDSAHLERVRIVEDTGPENGALVTAEPMGVGEDSLFPLQAALGYDIAQNLFVGPDNLLVEGTSDFTYLMVLSEHLKALGRAHLHERWRVLPAGGATNVPTFVALVGNALGVTVLIDGNGAGATKLRDMVGRGRLQQKRLLTTDQFCDTHPSDIEDLFTPGDYLKLYNAAYPDQKLKVSQLTGTDRVLARIDRAVKVGGGSGFVDHGRPADALLRGRDKLLSDLSDTTLGRFERLFEALNATLA